MCACVSARLPPRRPGAPARARRRELPCWLPRSRPGRRVAAARLAEVVSPMLKLNVYNRQGDAVGTVEVDEADFGGKVNRELLHEVVLMHLANQRAGTHSTLRRGEVAGSTKKLFRQKGTGNARV